MAAVDPSLSADRKRWILVATVLGSSLTFIDGSALGVALPAIQRDLGAGPAAVQWVSNAYLLTLGALVLIGGAAGDRFGRRKVFLIGVALFALASIACGRRRAQVLPHRGRGTAKRWRGLTSCWTLARFRGRCRHPLHHSSPSALDGPPPPVGEE